MNRKAKFTLTAWLLGLGLIIAGVVWIYPPLGLISGGLVLCGAGGFVPLRWALSRGLGENPPRDWFPPPPKEDEQSK